MMDKNKAMRHEPYDCKTCPYPLYRDELRIFCDACIRKILDEENEIQRELGDNKKDEINSRFD